MTRIRTLLTAAFVVMATITLAPAAQASPLPSKPLDPPCVYSEVATWNIGATPTFYSYPNLTYAQAHHGTSQHFKVHVYYASSCARTYLHLDGYNLILGAIYIVHVGVVRNGVQVQPDTQVGISQSNPSYSTTSFILGSSTWVQYDTVYSSSGTSGKLIHS